MGRTLDYEFSYGDQITVTPRNYPFSFLHMPSLSHHYAMIGMACVMDDYPLYYEAFNEKGLGIAGLNFVGNAVYFDPKPEKDNIAQFELIPWILGTCASLAEAKESLSRINLISTPFKKNLPLAQLHWIIADASGAITVESTIDGLFSSCSRSSGSSLTFSIVHTFTGLLKNVSNVRIPLISTDSLPTSVICNCSICCSIL